MKRTFDILDILIVLSSIPHAIWLALCYCWYLLSVAYLLTIGRVVLHIRIERDYKRSIQK